MKKTSLLLILFSIVIANADAQKNQLILTEEFRFHSDVNELIPNQKRTYQYDQLDNLISRTIYEWDKIENNYVISAELKRTYAGLDLIKEVGHIFYENPTDTSTYSRDFAYHQSGCIDSIRFNEVKEEELHYQSEFYNELTCQIDSSILYSTNDRRKINKTSYEYTSTQDVRRYFYNSTGVWEEVGRTEIDKNMEGQPTWLWTNASDFALEAARSYDYDEKGNLTLERYFVKFHPDDSLKISREYQVENTYNEKGQLIEKSTINTDYDYWTGEVELGESRYVNVYDYYCDGLIKEEQFFLNDKLKEEKRYYYQKGIECEDQVDVSFKIFPNPTNLGLHLISDVLLNEDSRIWIFDSAGRLAYSEKIIQRIDRYAISLSSLAKGFYIITLEGGGHQVSQRFVKN